MSSILFVYVFWLLMFLVKVMFTCYGLALFESLELDCPIFCFRITLLIFNWLWQGQNNCHWLLRASIVQIHELCFTCKQIYLGLQDSTWHIWFVPLWEQRNSSYHTCLVFTSVRAFYISKLQGSEYPNWQCFSPLFRSKNKNKMHTVKILTLHG